MSQELVKVQENMIAQLSPLEANSLELQAKAEAQVVTNEMQLASAVAVKKQITAHRKLIEDTRLGITRSFDNVKKALMNREAEIILPLDKGQTALGEKMLAYTEEVERKKAEEEARVKDMVARLSTNPYNCKETDDVDDEGARLKKVYSELKPEDQKNPEVKVAFTQSINQLEDRKAFLVEQAEQAAERERMAKEAADQSEERRKLEEEKAATAEKERKIEAEKQRLERETQRKADEEAAEKAKKERESESRRRVRTGVRTVMSFEIVAPEQVPRQYCTPNDTLIREAIKAGVVVPGVTVSHTKKI